MSIYHENHNKYPLYKNHYTLSGVVYFFKLTLYPIGSNLYFSSSVYTPSG